MSETYDSIVIGAGHNGMVAAHYLAAAGLRVLVLERRPTAGGITGPVDSLPGLTATVTNSPGSLEPKIVRDMGLEDHGLRFVKPDPTVVVPFHGGRAFVGWRDQKRVHEGLAQFSRHDADAYPAIIEFFNDFARRIGVSLFAPPPRFAELAARLRTPRDEADFAAIMFGSIREMLDNRLESDEVKTILAMLAQACGNVGPSTPGSPIGLLQRPMSLASSQVAAEHDPRRQPLRGSTGLPVGGMRGVAAAMERSLRSSGVTIRTDAAVTDIRVGADNQVLGVVLEGGEEIDAGIVLSNLNPKTTLLDLVPAGCLGSEVETGLRELRMEGAAFKVVLQLDGIPRFAFADSADYAHYAACQFRVGPTMDYLDKAYDDYRYGKPSEGPKLWGLIPTMTDPTLAPEGTHLMSLNVWYAPYHLKDTTWDAAKGPFIDRCVSVLAEFIPNIKDLITAVVGFSPVDLEREFGLLEGHQLHGDMTPGHMFSFRPLPQLSGYSTPVRQLYLCGSGSWPGGFVSGLPGHNAAQVAIADWQSELDDQSDADEQVAAEIGNLL
jgi:phytoene dehydrogenase-like protein